MRQGEVERRARARGLVVRRQHDVLEAVARVFRNSGGPLDFEQVSLRVDSTTAAALCEWGDPAHPDLGVGLRRALEMLVTTGRVECVRVVERSGASRVAGSSVRMVWRVLDN